MFDSVSIPVGFMSESESASVESGMEPGRTIDSIRDSLRKKPYY